MEKRKIIFSVFTFFVIISALSAKAPVEPDWVQNYRTVYPDSEYLAQRGSGKKGEQAKTDALAQLASYMQTSVNANFSTRYEATEEDEKVSEKTSIVNEINVSSNIALFGVEFTEPYYSKSEKKWYCLAYINRENAWNLYEAEVSKEKNIFLSFYNKAMQENEPVKRIKLLSDTLEAGDDFSNKLLLANILSKKLTRNAFGDEEELLSSIPSQIKQIQLANPVFIKVNEDNAGVIEAAVRKAFSNLGFITTTDAKNAGYTAKADINYNKAAGTNMVVLNPFMTLSLSGKNGSIYAFNAESERVVAPNDAAAKKIAAKNIAEKINQNLEDDVKKSLGL